MNLDYDYSYECDAEYCYPNTNVLTNKFNITDINQLNIAERELTALKIAKSKDEPIKGNFDLKHLMKIHKYIFGDIYLWAGKLRNVNISKGNQFCQCEFIEKYSSEIFDKIKKEHFLLLKSGDEVPKCLAYYLSEINVIHPFREGNGRTQRVFIKCLPRYIFNLSNK